MAYRSKIFVYRIMNTIISIVKRVSKQLTVDCRVPSNSSIWKIRHRFPKIIQNPKPIPTLKMV